MNIEICLNSEHRKLRFMDMVHNNMNTSLQHRLNNLLCIPILELDVLDDNLFTEICN